uniref:Uncharacterized protein n=1 Tax=Zea mays TaxID=4577 RepID=C4J7C8_MAIZE|nr:unknown [Zea mays]
MGDVENAVCCRYPFCFFSFCSRTLILTLIDSLVMTKYKGKKRAGKLPFVVSLR